MSARQTESGRGLNAVCGTDDVGVDSDGCRSVDFVQGTDDASRRLRCVRDALASHRRLRIAASGASANNATAPGAGICVNITERPNETWVPVSTT